MLTNYCILYTDGTAEIIAETNIYLARVNRRALQKTVARITLVE